MTRYLAGALLIALIAVSLMALTYRGNAANARTERDAAVTARKDAEEERDGLKTTLATERASAASMAGIGTKHEDDRAEAEHLPAAVVAGIGDGSIKLRKQWADCETSRLSDSVTAAIERDALSGLRAKDQGDLVRVGRDADDLAKACQAIVIGDRQ